MHRKDKNTKPVQPPENTESPPVNIVKIVTVAPEKIQQTITTGQVAAAQSVPETQTAIRTCTMNFQAPTTETPKKVEAAPSEKTAPPTPLQQTMQSNNTDELNMLLQQAIENQTLAKQLVTPNSGPHRNLILESCARQDSCATPLLLEALLKANLKSQQWLITFSDEDSNTPLHLSCQSGNITAVSSLLTNFSYCKKKMLQATNNQGNTPLHLAAQQGHTQCVNAIRKAALLGGGPLAQKLLNTENNKGQTPLMLAQKHKNEACIKLLDSVKKPSSSSAPFSF